MEILRTPDHRFAGLPDWPYEPRYVEVDTLRIHYVDVGPAHADPVLLLHGEPSWSYLYRHMIPVLVDAGHRAVAPDLVGFGRSDKPANPDDYSYQRHVDWTRGFVDALDLRAITLVGQDWGGLIGLRLVAEHPERFARVVLANAGLPTGDQRLSDEFYAWQRFSQRVGDMDIARVVQDGTTTRLSPEVLAAYDAPFPDRAYKAGAQVFPSLVPTTPDDPASDANRAAFKALTRFDKPFLTAFSNGDPLTRGADRPFRKHVPGAQGQPHTTIHGAGHFLQEDAGPRLARLVVDFIAANPTE